MKVALKGLVGNGTVQVAYYEGKAVEQGWYEGTPLFKNSGGKVRDIFFKTPRDAYWTHVDYAAQNKVEGAVIKMTLLGKQYHLGTGDGTLPVLEPIAGGGWRFPANSGPDVRECVDAEVVLESSVPARLHLLGLPDISRGGDLHASILPIIDGCSLRWISAGNSTGWIGGSVDYTFTSPSTGEVFFYGAVVVSKSPDVQANYITAGPLGDTSSVLHVVSSLSTGKSLRVDMNIPAIERSWTIKVERTIAEILS